jgi:uncharacterized protein
MTPSDATLRELLSRARTIAVVGLSPNPMRPSNSVAHYMQRSGYKIVPINPGHPTILGERSYRSLTDAARHQAIDIVNVFRRSEHVGPIVDEAIPIKPALIWLQLGVVDHDAEQRAEAAGIPFIMDHCLAIEHGRLKD